MHWDCPIIAPEDIALPLVSKEDAILSKLLWISKGSHRSRQDVVMMMRNAIPIDWDYLHQQAAMLKVVDLLQELHQIAKEI